MGWEVEGRLKRERTDVYLRLIHVDGWQKPTQHCKATILQLKKQKPIRASPITALVLKGKCLQGLTSGSGECPQTFLAQSITVDMLRPAHSWPSWQESMTASVVNQGGHSSAAPALLADQPT